MKVSDLVAMYELREPYSTSLPMLRTIGKGVKTVLELGAGLYSTAVFLDRTYYPDLESLISVEQNEAWVIGRDDQRHIAMMVAEPIETYLDTLDLNHFDLILVDNSSFMARRIETLRYISNRVGRSMVVAHDFENPESQEAAKEFTNGIVDDRQVPWTALLWRAR